MFLFEAVFYKIDSKKATLEFSLADKSHITFTQIIKKVNQERFDKWNLEFKASHEDWVTDMAVNSEIDKRWAAAKKELHLLGN